MPFGRWADRYIRKGAARVLVPLLVLLTALSALGCGYWVVHNFHRTDPVQPIELYGRYAMTIFGRYIDSSDSTVFRVYVDFVEPHEDTSMIDTIPILIVDSVSFVGACLTDSVAYRLNNSDDIGERYYWEWRKTANPRMWKSFEPAPRFGGDLSWRTEKLDPTDYEIRTRRLLPEKCDGRDLYVNVYFRELDRRTGAVLERDYRRFWFKVTTKRGMSMGLS